MPRGDAVMDPLPALVLAEIRELRIALADIATSGGEAAPRLAYSPSEFAAVMGLSASKVYGLVKRGLPVVRIGAQQRILPAEALAWLREHGADDRGDSPVTSPRPARSP